MREGLGEKWEDRPDFKTQNEGIKGRELQPEWTRVEGIQDRELQTKGARRGEILAEETEIQEIQVSRLEIRPCGK